MTHSGALKTNLIFTIFKVLIPLLLDDPLWVFSFGGKVRVNQVLIPLLLDDPLWVLIMNISQKLVACLNPSFAG